MPSATKQLVNASIFRSPALLLGTHLLHFKRSQEQFNIMYPQIAQAVAREIGGFLENDSLWLTCWSGSQEENPDLVLSCSEDSHGNKLPIFISSSHPMSTLENSDFLVPRLTKLITTLRSEVNDARVFSVFAPTPVAATFAQLWTSNTGIACESRPYYSATYARCTKRTFKNKQFTILGDVTYEMRLGVEKDVSAVAKLCYEFASTSEPFILSLQGAYEEAEMLIRHRKVWVHTINWPNRVEEIASIVAVTRESANVSAITKVYTNENWRGKRCAERLVRHVTKTLLYKYNKESVVLYVGDTNPARKVYQRAGFTDTTDEALCPSNGQFKKGDWLELGFDQSKVNLGHW